MATIVTRVAKGSPLSTIELDNNFTNLNNELITKLPSTSYTAADVLSKILTVDGSGSGLDADLLDGQASSSNNTVSTIVARDSAGNFSAGTITATLNGNASGVAGVTSNGILVRTSAGNHLARTITGTGSDITVSAGDGVSGNPTISVGANIPKINTNNSYTTLQSFALVTATGLSNDANSNLFLGSASLNTTSTNGFAYVPFVTGTPTGNPTGNTGRTPLVWDATNNKLYLYSGGIWNSVSSTIGDGTITPAKLSVGSPTWNTSGDVNLNGSVALGNSADDTTTITGRLSANGSVGTSGQVLSSRGSSTSPQWIDLSSGIGVNQTWQNVTSTRAFNVTYTNTTGKPIYVAANSNGGGVDTYNQISMNISGVVFIGSTGTSRGSPTTAAIFAIVPPSATYLISASYGLANWSELR